MEALKITSKTIRSLIVYLAVLATFYTLYLAKPIVLPVVVATFLALFCSPIVVKLEKIGIHRALASTSIISILIALLLGVVLLFTNPAHEWWQRLPDVANEISYSLGEVTQSIQEDVIGESNGETNSLSADSAGDTIREATFISLFQHFVSSTPIILMQVLATIFMVYFFLVYGHVMLLRFVQIKSSFSDKRKAVDIVNTMQEELSSYISTITIINGCLGFTVSIVFYFLGIPDAFLWGALAGTLNFAPYIGPLVASFAFALVAYLEFGDIFSALTVPGIYLLINLTESQFITPTLLGNKLDLNPLVLFVWLLILGWLWGAFGMLIGVPLLVCITIYLEKTGIAGNWYMLLKYKTEPTKSTDTNDTTIPEN